MTSTIVRTCPRCGTEKNGDEFYRRKNSKGESVPGGYCKPCANAVRDDYRKADPERDKRYQRANRLKRLYDLTVEEFEHQLWEVQLGLCALCADEIDESTAHIDHCHDTGRLRGLLCNGCNWALGKLGDNESGLRWALEYVRGVSDD